MPLEIKLTQWLIGGFVNCFPANTALRILEVSINRAGPRSHTAGLKSSCDVFHAGRWRSTRIPRPPRHPEAYADLTHIRCGISRWRYGSQLGTLCLLPTVSPEAGYRATVPPPPSIIDVILHPRPSPDNIFFSFASVRSQGSHPLDRPSLRPPVLSTCPLHTNSGCGKQRRILIGPW